MKLQVKVKNEGINYIIPPHGVTLTFHVPSKCRSNCPFCIVNQNYYNDDLKPSNDAIRKAAEALVNADFVGNFVISGGEPLDNMDFVMFISRSLYEGNDGRKPVYINTQMPADKFWDFWYRWNSDFGNRCVKRLISGMSISRHAARNSDEHFSIEGLQDHFIKQFAEKLSIRINCVLNDKTDIAGVVNRWKDAPVTVNFRRDYMKLTSEELHEPSDELKTKLEEAGFMGILHVDGCNICDTKCLLFKEQTKAKFYLHSGLYSTCLKHTFSGKGFYELHDLVVLPDGRVFDDWDIQNAHEVIFEG